MVHFDENVGGDYVAQVEIISALLVPRNDERYLNAWVEVDEVEITPQGEKALVTGAVGIPKKSEPAGVIWLAAVAYDELGKVVAVRKLELNSSLEPGTDRQFEILVYSLGPAIEKVDVLVEARP
jgi:hypothetical protein